MLALLTDDEHPLVRRAAGEALGILARRDQKLRADLGRLRTVLHDFDPVHRALLIADKPLAV